MPADYNSNNGPSMLTKAIVLDGGLDLVNPRLLVEPGRLVDCVNYECVDQVGYKKIDGFERYDGGPSWAVSGYWDILTTSPSVFVSPLGEGYDVIVSYTDSFGESRSFASKIQSIYSDDAPNLYWIVRLFPPYPADIETATAATITSVLYPHVFMTASTTGGVIDVTLTPDLAGSITNSDAVRAEVDALPGDVFPYGLQMYKDAMHAVADSQYIYLVYDHTISVSPVPLTSALQFFVGNRFRVNGSGGREGIILDYKFLFGDFGAPIEDGGTPGLDTAAVAKVLVRFTNSEALTTNTTVDIDRTDSTFGSPMQYWKYISSLTGTGATDDEPVWNGVIYKGITEGAARSDNNDWTSCDMGFEIAFNAGTSSIIPKELTLSTTEAQLAGDVQTAVGFPESAATSFSQSASMLAYQNSAASFPGTPATDGNGDLDQSAFSYDLESANATGVYLTDQGSVGGWGDGTKNTFRGFNFNIPSDVIITGITVTSRNFYNSSSVVNDVYFHTVKIKTSESLSVNKANPSVKLNQTTHGTSANARTYTFGGANDKWGLSNLTPESINEDGLVLEMTPAHVTNAGTAYLFWDQLNVTIHYFRPVGKLFFDDGSTEIEGKLVRVGLTKGSWAESAETPAEGVFHVYGLETNGTRNYVNVGDTISLTSGGSTIATVTSIRGAGLPSHNDIVTSDRRVQMQVSNYFLNPDWETIYGCTGLDRAFSYDGRYFRKIYTAYTQELDKPRHIASYRNYLALGYESGNVLLSKYGESGPEPENFDPLQGAREFSFVSRVVGLQELPDTSLGVFCSNKIERIVLNPNGSGGSLFYTASISPNTGAIEYTVAGFGGITLFCDQYGIRTVEQTDLYGDFVGRPISSVVSPWLRARLSSKTYWKDSKTAQKPLFAYTVRAKNQYRVVFDDGYVLSMNKNTMDDAPKFTFSLYGFNFGESFVPLTPIAHSLYLDSTGAERIHFAHWNRNGDSTSLENDPDLFKYVFEMEKGWSFDGQVFPAKVTLNLSFLETPFDYDIIKKVETHFLDYNATTLFSASGTKYSEEKSYSGMTFSSTYQPAGRNSSTSPAVGTDYEPYAKMMSTAIRGRPTYLKYKNTATATGDDSDSVIEPPHILQALLVQYLPAKTEN